MRASRKKTILVCLHVKKPTVVLPQLRVQLPEAAITSIPPLPSEPPPHRYRGGPKNRQNDPPPPEPPPLRTGCYDRLPKKTKRARYRLVVALQALFSTFVFLFTVPQKHRWARQESLQTPGAANRQFDEQQYMQPWQPPQYSALTWCVPSARSEKNRVESGSNGSGVWVSAASAQANRDHIAQQRQYSSGSLAVVL